MELYNALGVRPINLGGSPGIANLAGTSSFARPIDPIGYTYQNLISSPSPYLSNFINYTKSFSNSVYQPINDNFNYSGSPTAYPLQPTPGAVAGPADFSGVGFDSGFLPGDSGGGATDGGFFGVYPGGSTGGPDGGLFGDLGGILQPGGLAGQAIGAPDLSQLGLGTFGAVGANAGSFQGYIIALAIAGLALILIYLGLKTVAT